MHRSITAAVAATLLLAACSGANDSGEVEADLPPSAPSAADGMPHAMPGMDHDSMPGMNHGDMPGMDHDTMSGSGGAGAMNHGGTPAAAGGMAGMDHSRMPGMDGRPNEMARSAGGTGSMAGMGHSGMAMAAPGTPKPPQGMAGMDHGGMNMPRPMQGMDHANMPGMQTGAAAGTPTDDAGMEKLRALIAELVRDPEVQARIEADTALRRRWADEGVRRILVNRR